MNKEINNFCDLIKKLKDPDFAEQYKKDWDFSNYKIMTFDSDKKEWVVEKKLNKDE